MIDLYARCRSAVWGLRVNDGGRRVYIGFAGSNIDCLCRIFLLAAIIRSFVNTIAMDLFGIYITGIITTIISFLDG